MVFVCKRFSVYNNINTKIEIKYLATVKEISQNNFMSVESKILELYLVPFELLFSSKLILLYFTKYCSMID